MAYGKSRERDHEAIALYLCARFEQRIEDYARGAEISATELTRRVAGLLQSSANGEILGTSDRMSDLRSQSLGRGRGRPRSEMAMAGGAPSGAQEEQSPAAINRNGYQNDHRTDYGKARDPEKLERIRQMLAAGKSRKEIAAALGMNVSAVHYHINERNLMSAAGLKQHVPGEPSERIEQIRHMLASGMTRKDVAQTLGITKDGVGYYIRQYKMKEPMGTDTQGRPIPKRSPYTKSNPHWTQLPKNKARVAKWARKMRQKKEGKA